MTTMAVSVAHVDALRGLAAMTGVVCCDHRKRFMPWWDAVKPRRS